MKILHLIDSAGLYGAEMVLLTLAAAQLKFGDNVVIGSIGIQSNKEKAIVTASREQGIPVEIFPMPNHFSIKGVRSIAQFVKDFDIDIIHSHGYKADILLGFLPTSWRGAPMLATVHGYTGGSVKMRMYEWLDVIARRFMQGVVYVSAAMASDSKIHAWPNAKTEVIENGIKVDSELPLDADTIRELIRYKADGVLLLSIGRFAKEKNYFLLLAVLASLVRDNYNVKLVLIGVGKEGDALKERVSSLGLDDHVIFPGYRKDAVGFMAYADVFVLSSLTEGLPISLLEAMRAKVPVLSSAVGGIPKAIEHGRQGLLFESGNEKAMQYEMQAMVSSGLLRRSLAERAYIKFAENYSDVTMLQKYDSHYKKIMVPSNG